MPKKFSPMRFTAATEEAAVEGAMQLVGAARDEISYDFISQTAKGTTIRIRPFEPEPDDVEDAKPAPAPDVDEADEDVEADAPLSIDSMDDFDDADDSGDEDDDVEEDTDSDSGEDDSDDELDSDASLELADDEHDSDDEGDDDESDDSDDSDDENSEDEDDVEEEVEIEVDAEKMERALVLARTMLDKMGLDAQVEPGRAVVADTLPLSIEGEDVGILIGKHGATLQSFQYLMNLTLAGGGEVTTRVLVDAGNYRARRRESLAAVARGTAQRVRRENRPIKMEPMPSNERRIIHDILQSEPGISTQSEGREPHRCIVVAPGQSDYSGATGGRGNRGGRGMGNFSRGRGGRNRR